MDKININKINIDFIEKQISENLLILRDEYLSAISVEDAEYLKNKYKGKLMMYLHPSEIAFFEWLKDNDLAIWEDLWNDDISKEYSVSIDFLPYLVKYRQQFPICDLLNNVNYYFVPMHIKGLEEERLADTLKTRLGNKDALTPAQLLLIEISLNPIDIWHFAYKYQLPIEKAKDAVLQLVDDGNIVHFPEAGQLANFIDV